MDPLVVKFIEVVIMQLLVFGAVAAILIAAVWDVVQAKVRESRRTDRVALKPVTHNRLAHRHLGNWFAHHHIHNPFAQHHV